MARKSKGNQWWVHQRGAASVGYGSKAQADRAAKSLRNAKVSRSYAPGAHSGQHSVSDAPPTTRKGCWLLSLALLGGAVSAVSAAGYGVVSLTG